MTYTKKQVLPALHKSNKVTNPDMPSVEDKNYTATILKYANLALPFPQLDTNAKTVVAAINELYAHPGGSVVIPNPPIGEGGIELEQGGYIELEQGGVLATEQGGGTPVGNLTSISIDGDIYTIAGGGGGTTVIPNPSGGYMSNELLEQLLIDGKYYGIGPQSCNILLYANNWVPIYHGYKQIVDLSGVDSVDCIFVSPNPNNYDNYEEYCKCKVYCNDVYLDKLEFRCTTLPVNNLFVTIVRTPLGIRFWH